MKNAVDVILGGLFTGCSAMGLQYGQGLAHQPFAVLGRFYSTPRRTEECLPLSFPCLLPLRLPLSSLEQWPKERTLTPHLLVCEHHHLLHSSRGGCGGTAQIFRKDEPSTLPDLALFT
ncbi:hypothetical protein AVEN_136726-1 [Araneus ventricosus]|uniref:Uncharacterized protein n=1 Tax=Araneus ventricosus TaxID=182803 RepID=A0A4Y2EVY2_ARAVE|nr:hypothetical protein AVEN_136726-1 [Araneus ventricosus]